MNPRAVRALAVVAGAGLVLTACSDTVAGRGSIAVQNGPAGVSLAPTTAAPGSGFPSSSAPGPQSAPTGRSSTSPTATPTSGTTPTPAAPGSAKTPVGWAALVDSPSGMRFALPHAATPTVQDQPSNAGNVTDRVYQVSVGKVGVSVATITGASHPVVWNVDAYAKGFVTQFQAEGATDAVVTDRKPITVDGRSGLDFRFSFTTKSAPHQQAVWLIRAIVDGGTLLVFQTIAFATDPSTVLADVTSLQAQLVGSVALP